MGAFYLKKVAFQRLFSDEMHLNSIKKQHYPLSMHSIAFQAPTAKENLKSDKKPSQTTTKQTRWNFNPFKNKELKTPQEQPKCKFVPFVCSFVDTKNSKRFSVFEFLVYLK
ncbi:hypothetical protein [Aeromonas sp. SG16]|uniref:hypothetical protein n=1 Tax=Aeromonas sp. SG16 TaxID=2950548 RepID=UPI00210D374F|nr:hypothetical protein [Aeromonas sp. SG16]MCQ4053452.1 hypothetical protein [Aeromonas sp. SG16]